MDEKTKELLAVLDMPEESLDENRVILQPQYSALCKYQKENGYFGLPHIDCTLGGDKTKRFLAALAFRLRDELKSLEHYPQFQARLKVYNYVRRNVPQRCDINHIDEHWWAMEAKPIYWIIAALIAKSLGVTK